MARILTAPRLCGRAVNCIYSLGLHLRLQQENEDDLFQARLFCCIWAMDRLNAATNGRPVLIHERDCHQNFQSVFIQQEPIFRIFLEIVSLLDRVINIYRPGSSAETPNFEWAFPAFEDIVLESGAHFGIPIIGKHNKRFSFPTSR